METTINKGPHKVITIEADFCERCLTTFLVELGHWRNEFMKTQHQVRPKFKKPSKQDAETTRR